MTEAATTKPEESKAVELLNSVWVKNNNSTYVWKKTLCKYICKHIQRTSKKPR